MSRPDEDHAIVDAGLKALAFDSGPPLVGDKLRLIPSHCDRTVYDWYVCIRANRVEQLWPITVRS